jgi:hypothetical protein
VAHSIAHLGPPTPILRAGSGVENRRAPAGRVEARRRASPAAGKRRAPAEAGSGGRATGRSVVDRGISATGQRRAPAARGVRCHDRRRTLAPAVCHWL